MQTIGEILRDARHGKQTTLEDAARATKIKVDILERIEGDDYASLPGVTYTKGFIKLYAEYLGLDSHAIIEQFIRSQGGVRRQGIQLETEAAHRARKPNELKLPIRAVIFTVAGITAAVVIGVLGRWLLTGNKQHAIDTPQSGPAPAALKVEINALYEPSSKPVLPSFEMPVSR